MYALTFEIQVWILVVHGPQRPIFLFDPTAVVEDPSQTSLRKFMQWAVRLSAYRYTGVYIPGSEIVWSDVLDE